MALPAHKTPLGDAEAVAAELERSVGPLPWFQGIGIVRDLSQGFVVSLRVTPDAPEAQLPSSSVRGVRVVVERVPMAELLGG